MMVSKLSLVILAAAAGGVLWVEHSHRIKIEPSAPADVAAVGDGVCPENESVPISQDCLTFIQTGGGSNAHPRLKASDGLSVKSPELP
jgi:hypothetical protein